LKEINWLEPIELVRNADLALSWAIITIDGAVDIVDTPRSNVKESPEKPRDLVARLLGELQEKE